MKKVGFGEVEEIINDFVCKNKEFLAEVGVLVGVSRGGLVPAALLAAKIDKPLVAVYIDKSDEIFFDRGEWIAGKNVLAVDDIIRSGKTLRLVNDRLKNFCAPQNVSFFTLFRVLPLNNPKFNIPSFSRKIDEDVVFLWDHDRK